MLDGLMLKVIVPDHDRRTGFMDRQPDPGFTARILAFSRDMAREPSLGDGRFLRSKQAHPLGQLDPASELRTGTTPGGTARDRLPRTGQRIGKALPEPTDPLRCAVCNHHPAIWWLGEIESLLPLQGGRHQEHRCAKRHEEDVHAFWGALRKASILAASLHPATASSLLIRPVR